MRSTGRKDTLLHSTHSLNGFVLPGAATAPTDQQAIDRLLAQAATISAVSAAEAATLDEEGHFPAATFAHIAAAGLLAAPLPHALQPQSKHRANSAYSRCRKRGPQICGPLGASSPLSRGGNSPQRVRMPS